MKDSWTKELFGENGDGICLKQSESLIENAFLVLRPSRIRNEGWLDNLHQDLLNVGERMNGETLILDLSRLEHLPLSLVGMIFAIKEELAENGSQLILKGIDRDAVSKGAWKRIVKNFKFYHPHPIAAYGALT